MNERSFIILNYLKHVSNGSLIFDIEDVGRISGMIASYSYRDP